MRALYRLNAAEGQALYGKTYTSAAQLLDMYHAYTQQPTDTGNEENAAGAAALLPLLPQRLRLTNVLEAALQAVDPSLALPFWDYTVEGEEVGDKTAGCPARVPDGFVPSPLILFLPCLKLVCRSAAAATQTPSSTGDIISAARPFLIFN